MARMRVKGLSEYSQQLNKLYAETEPIIGASLHEGAGVMADAVKAAINQIPIRSPDEIGSSDHMVSGILEIQRIGLEVSFGITKMQKEPNNYNVKLGFDGYNRCVTKAFPKGQPNQLIARSIETGTSWLQPCHFLSIAINNNKDNALQRLVERFDEEVGKRIDTGGI